MPAKKAKKRTKRANPSTDFLRSLSDGLLQRLHAAETWEDVADVLCEWVEIPDLETRQGLKKVHRNFDEVTGKLRRLFEFAMQSQLYILANGIVAIYSRICVDAILCDRVFAETEHLETLFTLTGHSQCRQNALEALSTLAWEASQAIRVAIAKRSLELYATLAERPEDPQARELVCLTLVRAAGAVVARKDPPSAAEARYVDLARLIRTALLCLRQPSPSSILAHNAITMFRQAAHHRAQDFFANSDALSFILACATSNSTHVRAEAVAAVVRLHIRSSNEQNRDPIIPSPDMPWPEYIESKLRAYGKARCDTIISSVTNIDFQESIGRVIEDRNFLRLGRELGEYIMRTETAVPVGPMMSVNPITGHLQSDDFGLPFIRWVDALSYCAQEIRRHGRPEEVELADVLDCKYLASNGRHKEACEIAMRAVERNPQVGFFYYILAIGADEDTDAATGLRYAKKGLKCRLLPSCVKYGLLFFASQGADALALRKLTGAGSDPEALVEGYAFAQSALEDTLEFIRTAPPDHRCMLTICYWHVMLSFLVRGHEIGHDLTQLKHAWEAIRLAEYIAEHIGRPILDTQDRAATYFIQSRMAVAIKDWDNTMITKLFREAGVETFTDSTEGSLTAWLQRAEPEDINKYGRELKNSPRYQPPVDIEKIVLYRCSWCMNPSAVLRKCSGCSRVRYCDPQCQSQHWTSSHRKACDRNHQKPNPTAT